MKRAPRRPASLLVASPLLLALGCGADGPVTPGAGTQTPGTQTPAPGTQTPTPGTQTPGTQTPGTQTPAPGTQPPTPETQPPAPGTQTPAPGTQPPSGVALAPKRGVVAGTVTSAAGAPLAGAEISILGTTTAGMRAAFFPVTDARGVYALPVADGVYTTSAQYDFDFGGKKFRMRLHPADGRPTPSLPSSDGIVSSFVWKLAGLRPEARDATAGFSYYGGEVKFGIDDVRSESFQTRIFASEFPQGFTAKVTLTPEGPLADGSAGAPLTFEKQVKSQSETDFSGLDVPLGRYTITATATKPDGTSRPLQIVDVNKYGVRKPSPPAASAKLEFLPSTGATGGLETMGVSFIYGAPYPQP